MNNLKCSTEFTFVSLKKIMFLSLLIFLVFGCEEEASEPLTSERIKIIVGQETYDDVSNKLTVGQSTSDAFEINNVDIVGDLLQIDISYSGGCETHSFEMLWPENVDQIYPPVIPVILNHNSNNDLCEAFINEVLQVNLAGNILNYDSKTISNIEIIVINGSNAINKVSSKD